MHQPQSVCHHTLMSQPCQSVLWGVSSCWTRLGTSICLSSYLDVRAMAECLIWDLLLLQRGRRTSAWRAWSATATRSGGACLAGPRQFVMRSARSTQTAGEPTFTLYRKYQNVYFWVTQDVAGSRSRLLTPCSLSEQHSRPCGPTCCIYCTPSAVLLYDAAVHPGELGVYLRASFAWILTACCLYAGQE